MLYFHSSEPQKCAKVEVGGLAKDWRSVYAQSVAMSSTSSIETPISATVKTEWAGKKASSKAVKRYVYASATIY